jgi:hypothetical protein
MSAITLAQCNPLWVSSFAAAVRMMVMLLRKEIVLLSPFLLSFCCCTMVLRNCCFVLCLSYVLCVRTYFTVCGPGVLVRKCFVRTNAARCYCVRLYRVWPMKSPLTLKLHYHGLLLNYSTCQSYLRKVPSYSLYTTYYYLPFLLLHTVLVLIDTHPMIYSTYIHDAIDDDLTIYQQQRPHSTTA